MSALVDYEDLYTAICEELKIPLTDGVTLARIKRDINMVYLNHVIPFKPRAWWWLEKKDRIITYEKVDSGTVAVTHNSTDLTFSIAPDVSLSGYYIQLTGFPEVIRIESHNAGETNATLEDVWVLDTAAANGFKAWRDYATLDADVKDVIAITHHRRTTPLDALANPKFYEVRNRNPGFEGFPHYYNTGDFDANGQRIVRWYPACSDTMVTLHVEGRQEATALSLDADEPLMPVEDRIVLFYGACSRAWARERNETEASKNWNLFMAKLAEMAAKSGDAPQVVEIETDRDYLYRKRYRRWAKRGYGGNFERD